MNPVPPFRSDNIAGACPGVLEAIPRMNAGVAAAYGADEPSIALNDAMSDVFERQCWCFPVGTGTAANALSLAAIASGKAMIACHTDAHILRHEDDAVRFFSPGVTLAPLPGENGRMMPDALADLAREKAGAAAIRWSALSLTQLTEAGTVYRRDDVAMLAAIAHDHGALVHMDGARFANAVVALGCTPAEASWRSGVDVLSFGATKNGTINTDAVVTFDQAIAESVRSRLRRSGQLYSKMRFMAAQLLAYLEGGLWLRNAAHANAMARRLRDHIAHCRGVEILHEVDGNHLFLRLHELRATRLMKVGALPWRSGTDARGQPVYRLVTSFATTSAEIDAFAALLAEHPAQA
jgi:threonine aldolase